MKRNAAEVNNIIRFWSAVPGVDSVRIKEDETNLFQLGHDPAHFKYPCHYLWRGPLYVKHNGDVYPCCQSYMLDGSPIGWIDELILPPCSRYGIPIPRSICEPCMHKGGQARFRCAPVAAARFRTQLL